MNKKARLNYIHALSSQVERKKMYKAKKQWVVAGISFLVATGLGAVGSHLTTHADTTPKVSANIQRNSNATSSATSPVTTAKGIGTQANAMHKTLVNNAATQKPQSSSNQIPSAKASATPASSKVSGNQASSSNTKSSVASNVGTSGNDMNTLDLGNQPQQNRNWNYVQNGIKFTQKGNKPQIKMVLKDTPQYSGTWGTAKWTLDNRGNYTIYGGAITPNSGDSHVNTNLVKHIYTHDVIVPNFYGTFSYYSNLETADLTGMDTATVTSMNQLFQYDNHLKSVNITGLDTHNVINMGAMFGSDPNLKHIIGLNTLDVSDLSNINWAFAGDTSLKRLDLSSFNTRNMVQANNQNGLSHMLSYNGIDTIILGSDTSLLSSAGLSDNWVNISSDNPQSLTGTELEDGKIHHGVWTKNAEIVHLKAPNNQIIANDIVYKPYSNSQRYNVSNLVLGTPSTYHIDSNQSILVNGGISNINVDTSSDYNSSVANSAENIANNSANGAIKQAENTITSLRNNNTSLDNEVNYANSGASNADALDSAIINVLSNGTYNSSGLNGNDTSLLNSLKTKYSDWNKASSTATSNTNNANVLASALNDVAEGSSYASNSALTNTDYSLLSSMAADYSRWNNASSSAQAGSTQAQNASSQADSASKSISNFVASLSVSNGASLTIQNAIDSAVSRAESSADDTFTTQSSYNNLFSNNSSSTITSAAKSVASSIASSYASSLVSSVSGSSSYTGTVDKVASTYASSIVNKDLLSYEKVASEKADIDSLTTGSNGSKGTISYMASSYAQSVANSLLNNSGNGNNTTLAPISSIASSYANSYAQSMFGSADSNGTVSNVVSSLASSITANYVSNSTFDNLSTELSNYNTVASSATSAYNSVSSAFSTLGLNSSGSYNSSSNTVLSRLSAIEANLGSASSIGTQLSSINTQLSSSASSNTIASEVAALNSALGKNLSSASSAISWVENNGSASVSANSTAIKNLQSSTAITLTFMSGDTQIHSPITLTEGYIEANGSKVSGKSNTYDVTSLLNINIRGYYVKNNHYQITISPNANNGGVDQMSLSSSVGAANYGKGFNAIENNGMKALHLGSPAEHKALDEGSVATTNLQDNNSNKNVIEVQGVPIQYTGTITLNFKNGTDIIKSIPIPYTVNTSVGKKNINILENADNQSSDEQKPSDYLNKVIKGFDTSNFGNETDSGNYIISKVKPSDVSSNYQYSDSMPTDKEKGANPVINFTANQVSDTIQFMNGTNKVGSDVEKGANDTQGSTKDIGITAPKSYQLVNSDTTFTYNQGGTVKVPVVSANANTTNSPENNKSNVPNSDENPNNSSNAKEKPYTVTITINDWDSTGNNKVRTYYKYVQIQGAQGNSYDLRPSDYLTNGYKVSLSGKSNNSNITGTIGAQGISTLTGAWNFYADPSKTAGDINGSKGKSASKPNAPSSDKSPVSPNVPKPNNRNNNSNNPTAPSNSTNVNNTRNDIATIYIVKRINNQNAKISSYTINMNKKPIGYSYDITASDVQNYVKNSDAQLSSDYVSNKDDNNQDFKGFIQADGSLSNGTATFYYDVDPSQIATMKVIYQNSDGDYINYETGADLDTSTNGAIQTITPSDLAQLGALGDPVSVKSYIHAPKGYYLNNSNNYDVVLSSPVTLPHGLYVLRAVMPSASKPNSNSTKPSSSATINMNSAQLSSFADEIGTHITITPQSAVNETVDGSALNNLASEVATNNKEISSLVNKPTSAASINYDYFNNLVNTGVNKLTNAINRDFKSNINHVHAKPVTPKKTVSKRTYSYLKWLRVVKPLKLYNNNHEVVRTIKPRHRITLNVKAAYKAHSHIIFKVSYKHHNYFIKANNKAIKNAYLPASHKLVGRKVRVLYNVYANRGKTSNRVKTLHRGYSARIRNIVRIGNHNITRIQLADGLWISANMNYVEVYN